MLFHSQVFLGLFLPLCLAAFWGARKMSASQAALKIILLVFSWVFYAYWDVRLFPLLAGSILVNYLIATAMGRRPWWDRIAPYLAGAVNLGLLGAFKYTFFFAETAALLFDLPQPRFSIILPLGISFFTFQQISYLIDRHRGTAPRYSLLDYALYVSFFPQLIAGPIVRHGDLIPQFRRLGEVNSRQIGAGLLLFAMGLSKKLLIADMMSPIADPVFAASLTAPVGAISAWAAMLAFTFQLYFDFSAYSDMALGLGLLFGMRLPVNFVSPYQATTIADFWRRWHVTLSSFLRDYVYEPCAQAFSGLGTASRYAALLVTMLLSGLWHGAGWTFIIWGAGHGAALCTHRLWRRMGFAMIAPLGWALTMGFWIITIPFFRSETVGSAWTMLTSALGLATAGAGLPVPSDTEQVLLLAAAALIAFAMPNAQTIAASRWWMRPAMGLAVGGALALVFLYVGDARQPEFIYFQF